MPANAQPKPLRVFVSYSHDSAGHAERVLALADRLRRDGLDAWIDQYDPEPEQGWPRWMVDEIDRADRVLAICTETYRRRFEGRETEGGLGVDWEGAVLTGEREGARGLHHGREVAREVREVDARRPRFEPGTDPALEPEAVAGEESVDERRVLFLPELLVDRRHLRVVHRPIERPQDAIEQSRAARRPRDVMVAGHRDEQRLRRAGAREVAEEVVEEGVDLGVLRVGARVRQVAGEEEQVGGAEDLARGRGLTLATRRRCFRRPDPLADSRQRTRPH